MGGHFARGKWKADRSAPHGQFGTGLPLVATKLFSAFPTDPITRRLAVADPDLLIPAGHSYLQSCAALPTGLGADYTADPDTVVQDTQLGAWLLNPRLWGKTNRVLRRPRTLLVTGALGLMGNLFREYIAANCEAFTKADIDILVTQGGSQRASRICPLAAIAPLTSGSWLTLGGVQSDTPPGGQVLGYIQPDSPDPTGYEGGGDLYVANIGAERMAFGGMTIFFSTCQTHTQGVGTSDGDQWGYTFIVQTFIDAISGSDPGDQSFPGCTEVGHNTVVLGNTTRFQTFTNDARITADRTILAAWADVFASLRVAFWGAEGQTTQSVQGDPNPPDPVAFNPGTPATVAATIDGGTGLVTYQALPGDTSSTADQEASAAAVLADAATFFGL